MNIILLGCPGAGKGSQATKISEHYGLPHISTGDAFRANIKKGTEIGIYAKSFIDKGLLVPDDVTVKIVAGRLINEDCKGGFLLDGFPRNIFQAEALKKLAKIDAVINIDVDFKIIVARLTGRRSCVCGESYHISTYKENVCKKCGKTLYIREDDNESTINQRLETYKEQTQPLIDFYSEQRILYNVDGNKSVDKVFEDIKRILNDNN